MTSSARCCASIEQRALAQQMGPSDDGVQRRPQLVRQRRQKLVLEPVGLLEQLVSRRQFRLMLLRRQIGHHETNALAVLERAKGQIGGQRGPVGGVYLDFALARQRLAFDEEREKLGLLFGGDKVAERGADEFLVRCA